MSICESCPLYNKQDEACNAEPARRLMLPALLTKLARKSSRTFMIPANCPNSLILKPQTYEVKDEFGQFEGVMNTLSLIQQGSDTDESNFIANVMISAHEKPAHLVRGDMPLGHHTNMNHNPNHLQN